MNVSSVTLVELCVCVLRVESGPEVIKLSSCSTHILNSAEHEIFPAQKC